MSGLSRTVRTSHTIADVSELHLKNYLVLMGGRGGGRRRGITGIVYQVYQTVCSIVRIWSPLPPTTEVSTSPLLDTKKGGGSNTLAGEGVWGPKSDDWVESLALCILCGGRLTRAHFLTVLNIDHFIYLLFKT